MDKRDLFNILKNIVDRTSDPEEKMYLLIDLILHNLNECEGFEEQIQS